MPTRAHVVVGHGEQMGVLVTVFDVDTKDRVFNDVGVGGGRDTAGSVIVIVNGVGADPQSQVTDSALLQINRFGSNSCPLGQFMTALG